MVDFLLLEIKLFSISVVLALHIYSFWAKLIITKFHTLKKNNQRLQFDLKMEQGLVKCFNLKDFDLNFNLHILLYSNYLHVVFLPFRAIFNVNKTFTEFYSVLSSGNYNKLLM